MTCPSSGLEAADRTLASPSGNWIVLSTRDFGWTKNGPTQTATTPSAVSDERPGRLPAVADRDQHDGHHQGRPRGRLHRRGDAERQARQDREVDRGRTAVEQGEPEAEEPDHRHVGAADGELEGDHRAARDQDRPATRVPGAALPERQPEHGQEDDAEPDPRVGQQTAVEDRAGQPEQRHHRQVRVIGVRVLGRRERRRARVRRALVDQHRPGSGDHPHLGLLQPLGRHPGQRRQQRPDERQARAPRRRRARS